MVLPSSCVQCVMGQWFCPKINTSSRRFLTICSFTALCEDGNHPFNPIPVSVAHQTEVILVSSGHCCLLLNPLSLPSDRLRKTFQFNHHEIFPLCSGSSMKCWLLEAVVIASKYISLSKHAADGLCLTLCLIPGLLDCFNIDTKNHKIIKGSKQAQFGYTVQQHVAGGQKW